VTYPELVENWHRTSNTLVLLAAPDELRLGWLYADAVAGGLHAIAFHEPDLGGALTAVAFEPAAHRLLAHLPLVLSRRREVKT
jgi:hypothetical protein